jgi:hypothetical protein
MPKLGASPPVAMELRVTPSGAGKSLQARSLQHLERSISLETWACQYMSSALASILVFAR